jgi:murein DD-endopeptidase MepM/ murein hydrolase activator NlpD
MAYSQFGRRDLHYPHHDFGRPAQHPAAARVWKFGVLVTTLLFLLWSGAATFYLVYRDDALMFLARRQTEMVQSYDAQLTALETEIERLKSLKLVDQERVDRAVLDLGRRQALVEQRQRELANIPPPKGSARALVGEDVTGTIVPNGPLPPSAPGAIPKPSPISDTIIFMPPPGRSATLESRPVPPSATRLGSLDVSNPTEARVGELSRGLDRLQTCQAESLSRLEEAYEGSEARARTVLSDLGVSVPPPSLAKRVLAIGGPLLPFVSSDDPFERQMTRVRANAATMAELGQLVDRVPVRRPVPPRAEVTSGFGPRLDPFVKQYAFHSGIDLKGEPGDVARATAGGRVTIASYQGGYGLLVEIDHGNGLATRYGHLSAIDINEGQIVEAGEPVGRIGTTGRSTGPHLHYEVRVAGEPVDPLHYLRAGVRLNSAP